MMELTDRDRVRRVIFLCCSFARNLTFYRVGWSEQARPLMAKSHPHESFWRQANGNFLDMAVLDWYKLFGDARGKHSWRKVIADPAGFEAELLGHLGITADAFGADIKAMQNYRDKFVAHLDNENEMDIPLFDVAKSAIGFCHRKIVETPAYAGFFYGLPETPDKFARGYYDQCTKEAESVYRAIQLIC